MHEFLEHPSETLVEVRAQTVNEVFRDAALALFEIMTDPASLSGEWTTDVELNGTERALLLIDWLNRLIYLSEIHHVFLGEFEVLVQEAADRGLQLRATVKGEKIHDLHERFSHAKSATYGLFEWIETDSGHRVRFVIDV